MPSESIERSQPTPLTAEQQARVLDNLDIPPLVVAGLDPEFKEALGEEEDVIQIAYECLVHLAQIVPARSFRSNVKVEIGRRLRSAYQAAEREKGQLATAVELASIAYAEADEKRQDPEEAVKATLRRQLIAQALADRAVMSERAATVVKLYWELGTDEAYTQAEIAAILGIGKSRVQQYTEKGPERLLRSRYAPGLLDVSDAAPDALRHHRRGKW